MNVDHVLITILRSLTILLLGAGAAWLAWRIAAHFRARGRSRRMQGDRRRRRIRVGRDRRVGARREREAARARLDDLVQSMESSTHPPAPRKQ